METYEYVGCFLDHATLAQAVQSLRTSPLKNEKRTPHVTFEYNPACVNTDLFGTPIRVTVTGYGNDGENEGLRVVLTSDDERINAVIRGIPVPHITLAVSDTALAVNTRYLHFEDVAPIQLTGAYGGHIEP